MSIRARSNKLFHHPGMGRSDETVGVEIRLTGFNAQDPLWQRLSPGPRLLPHGPLSLETAREWKANAVRIPFHPVTIRHAGDGDWMRGLEQVSLELDWILLAAKALGLLVLIDFHSIGFPSDETTFEFDEAPYENLYETSQFEIESFWRHVARRYHDHPAVAGFEIFNEATRDSAFGNQDDWNLHADWAENLIREIIRPVAAETLVIVGGLHFGYDLEGALARPVRDSNVAYSSHPYPHHSQAKTWDRAFGKVSERHPVLLTEVGFANEGFFGRQHHRGFRDWELELQSFADARSLSFFAWNFSHSWEPTLLNPDFTPNEAGLFFKNWIETVASETASSNSLTWSLSNSSSV